MLTDTIVLLFLKKNLLDRRIRGMEVVEVNEIVISFSFTLVSKDEPF
jgi:hypothetical protein